MSQVRARRTVCVAAALGAVACSLPAAAQAALINFGSTLGAPATVAIAHPVDTAFWSTALGAGGRARAPQAGRVVSVRIGGCAKRGSGGQLPLTQVHFEVLVAGRGSEATVKVTSGPFNLPVCGGSVSGATVSTFHPVNMCVAQGDFVAFNDEGGFAPAGFRNGVGYEVFARVPTAATSSFTSGGGTNNGASLHGSAHQGLELLMALQLGTGRNAGVCPG